MDESKSCIDCKYCLIYGEETMACTLAAVFVNENMCCDEFSPETKKHSQNG